MSSKMTIPMIKAWLDQHKVYYTARMKKQDLLDRMTRFQTRLLTDSMSLMTIASTSSVTEQVSEDTSMKTDAETEQVSEDTSMKTEQQQMSETVIPENDQLSDDTSMKTDAETEQVNEIVSIEEEDDSKTEIMYDPVDEWMTRMETVSMENIKLLKRRDVVEWIFHKTYTTHEQEDIWGRALMEELHPSVEMDKWILKMGYDLTYELFALYNFTYTKPKTYEGVSRMDFKTRKAVWRVKISSQIYEDKPKDTMSPLLMKYLEVPDAYKVPLNILCIAGSEHKAIHHFDILNTVCDKKREILEMYALRYDIQFVAFTDMMMEFLSM